MSGTPTPTAADLRAMVDARPWMISPEVAVRLLAGADAMDERDRLREEYNSARSLLDTIADAPLKLDLARQTIDRLRADRAALTVALAGLRYKDEPGRFCDHAAAPCTRCDRAAAALTEHGGE